MAIHKYLSPPVGGDGYLLILMICPRLSLAHDRLHRIFHTLTLNLPFFCIYIPIRI